MYNIANKIGGDDFKVKLDITIGQCYSLQKFCLSHKSYQKYCASFSFFAQYVKYSVIKLRILYIIE